MRIVNLLLVHHTVEHQNLILPEVMAELRKLDGSIRCRLVSDGRPRLKHRLWTLGMPTVVVSMRPVSSRKPHRFAPRWAVVWEQTALDKIQELTALERAGIRVPKWAVLRKDTEPDLSCFGDVVVVKPVSAHKGALVRVMRRSRVRWRPLQVERRGISESLIVQQYVHTGPWPVSYKVGTVFGEPIYAMRLVADRKRKPFEGEPANSREFVGRTVVAPSRGSTASGAVPGDVIEFAKQVQKAFPTVPVLGTDIVRHHSTGELYALEVHSPGWTFHLTSILYDRLLRERNLDLRAQFGGAAAVARGIYRRLQEARC